MKKIISLLLFSLLIAMPSFSQVQNKFFGATMGVSDINTTYSCMYNYFGEQPAYPFGILSIQHKSFAGYKWDAINAHFRNGIFAQLNLRYNNNYKASSQTILNMYNTLKTELSNKYGNRLKKNIIPDENGESGFYYFDGRYAVSLILYWQIKAKKKVYHEVDLWYWDAKIINEPERPRINSEL